MAKFAAALEDALDEKEPVETDDTETTETDESEDTDESTESDETESTDDKDEKSESDDEKKDDEEVIPEDEKNDGSWFAPKKETKKVDEKVDGKAPQKKMPDTVRTKIEAEVRTKIDAERPWAKDISPEEGTKIRELYDMGQKNPLQLAHAILESINANPVSRSQLLPYFESIGLVPRGTTQATQTADEDPMPVLKVDTATGASPESFAQWQKDTHAWQQRQILKEVDKRLAPQQQRDQQVQQQQQQDQQQQAMLTRDSERVKRTVLQQPDFKDLKDDIGKLYNAIPRPWLNVQTGMGDPNHPEYRDEPTLMYEAYYQAKANRAEANVKKVATDLKNKQKVKSLNPQSGTGGTPVKKPKGFLDALKQAANSKD